MDVINKYPNSPLVVVDWSAASSPPSAALSAQIAEILMTRGFFYVENVPGYSASALESTVKWFYGKSLDFKMQVARKGIADRIHNAGFYVVIDGLVFVQLCHSNYVIRFVSFSGDRGFPIFSCERLRELRAI